MEKREGDIFIEVAFDNERISDWEWDDCRRPGNCVTMGKVLDLTLAR